MFTSKLESQPLIYCTSVFSLQYVYSNFQATSCIRNLKLSIMIIFIIMKCA